MAENDIDHLIARNNHLAALREALCNGAEKQIREILINLDTALEGIGEKIDYIRVDTRNFAGLAVEIMTEDR